MGKKLAIKGHSTRGKEVIELLEMLGGKNESVTEGGYENLYYCIDDDGDINYFSGLELDEALTVFTLDEFYEKYPFKVGDKVTLDNKLCAVIWMCWECNNIYYTVHAQGTDGVYTKKVTADELKPYKETDINNMNTKLEYPGRNREDVLFDSIIWHLRNSVNNGKQNLSGGECEDYFREVIKKNNENKMKNVLAELLEHIKTTPKDELEKEFNELEEWSNVGPTVEEFRAFCECVNKKPAYPTTYVECCEVIANSKPYAMNEHYTDVNKLLQTLQTLIICRNAYRKIAGEEMGLGKPWEPTMETVYCISRNNNVMKCSYRGGKSNILEFPTEEMRDAFYENFKELIERCKELL